MGSVTQLYDCTKRLYEHLRKGLPKTDREAYIEKIEHLLEERQRYMQQLPEEFDGEETAIGKTTVDIDRSVQRMLAIVFDQIKEDVDQFQRHKVTNERYVHPYRKGSADGMFLDKRK